MGTCEESNLSSMETQNEINMGNETNTMGISSNGTHNHVDDDDGDRQNQLTEEEAIVVQLENVELQEEEEEGEEEEEETHIYPLRPHVVDCTFYLKTGTCKFGLNCRFNHPPKRVFQPVGNKEDGTEEISGLAVDTGKIECKYFLTPGGCKYGDGCRYNHSRGRSETEGPELNFLGLPIRPSEKECIFYLRNGSCGYGVNCRFHHPDPSAAKESQPVNSRANGQSFRGGDNFPKTFVREPLHSSGVSQGNFSELSNGINSRNFLPSGMNSYHQSMPHNPEWNQNQVNVPLSANNIPLPHQVMNNFSKKADPLTNYEHVMQIEEFPERLGQPDCDYFMKTGDCKYRSQCRYNHPINRASNLRLPLLSTKGHFSKSATRFPLETTEHTNSNPSIVRKSGISSNHHHQHQVMQNGEYPERPGQPECEYFMKTGQCKFRAACRYHHPRNRMSTLSSEYALNEKGLPLRPGSKICRNYEQQGVCKYGTSCLFHHPDDSSPAVPVADEDHHPTDVTVAADLEPPAGNNADSDWGDGWAM